MARSVSCILLGVCPIHAQPTRAPWPTLLGPARLQRPVHAPLVSRAGGDGPCLRHCTRHPRLSATALAAAADLHHWRHDRTYSWPQMKSARRAHGSGWRKWRATGQRWPRRAGAASSTEIWAAVATSATRPLQQRQHGCNQVLTSHRKKIPAGAIRRGRAGKETIREDIEASAAAGPSVAAGRCAALRIAAAIERRLDAHETTFKSYTRYAHNALGELRTPAGADLCEACRKCGVRCPVRAAWPWLRPLGVPCPVRTGTVCRAF